MIIRLRKSQSKSLNYIIINWQEENRITIMDQMIKQEDEDGSPSSQLQQQAVDPVYTQKIWNSGHWSLEQNMKCIAYFQFNKAHLHSKLKMKENKFFKQMSIFVATRNPIQCRSQCQKLLRKSKSFYNIIHNFKNEYSEERFEEEFEKYSQNPLIRFKGTIQMQTFEKHAEMSRQTQVQTEKSYLHRKFKERQAYQQAQESLAVMSEFPFFRAGWWL